MLQPLQSKIIAIFCYLIGIGLAIIGIYIGDTDNSPGAALIGFVLLLGFAWLGTRMLWRIHQRNNRPQ